MASKEEGACQTWVLRVSIHCEGCKKKVKKILQNISGVLSVEIDSKQNKVMVTGNVDADALIRRLAKSGKHAELWPENKPANPNPNPNPNSHLKGKNKEKEPEASGEKEQPAGEKVATTDKTPADTNSETPSKKPAEIAPEQKEKEAPSSSKEEAPKPDKKLETKPEKAPAETSPDTDTKPAGGAGKKKGKKQVESSEGHVRNLPPYQPQLQYPVPEYQHLAYAVSYNAAHPATSHSYYATMPPVPQQSYMHSDNPYSGYSQPLAQEYYPPSSENYYDSYHFSPLQEGQNYYNTNYDGSERYYGSMEPRASSSQEGLDMFSEENANGCKIM